MEPFLERLAKLLLQRHRNELDRVAVVLPGRRAGLHLRKYLARSAGTTLWSPELFDPGSFMQRVSGMRQGGTTEMLFLLHQAHRDVEGDRAEPLAEFLKWAPVTLRDMSEVDAHLLDPDQLYRDLRAYHEIEEWSFRGSEALSPSQQRSLQQWARTGALHKRFTELMNERHVGTSGAVARKAVDALRDKLWRSPWAMTWFAGLNALDPATTAVVQHLRKQQTGQVAWDSDRYYLEDPQQEAGRFLRRSMKEVGNGAFHPINGIVEGDRTIDVATVPNRLAQAHHAAQWLAGLSLEQRADTVVVLADESLLLPLIDALPADIGPMNVTMGLSLTALPVNGLVEAFLQVHSTPAMGMILADLERLLLHPFLYEGARTTKLLEQLHTCGSTRISSESLLIMARHADFAHADHLRAALAPVEQSSDVHSRVRALIAWAKQCRAADRLAVEQLFHLAQVERALEQALTRYGASGIDAATYRLLRQRALRDERLTLLGEPLTGLQIMGLLETRSIDHERVIVLGATEETLPGTATAQSWIPLDLRRYHGLPLPSDAQAIAAYHVHRLLHHSRELRLVGHGGGDGSGEPTRFIAQWRHDLVPNTRTRINDDVQRANMPSRSTAAIVVAKSTAVIERLDSLAARGFSPTAIGTWLRCPLDFHITHVLGIRPPDHNDGTLGSDVLGSAVHRTLESIYRPSLGAVLEASALRTAAKEVHERLLTQLRKDFPDRVLAEGNFRLRIEMATHAMANYLEREADRCASVTTIPLALESSLSASLGPLVKLRGTCDRMEERNGLMHLLDLKTGSVKPEDLRLKSLERADLLPRHRYALQLVIYAFMAFQQESALNVMRAGVVPLRKPSDAEGVWLTINGSNLIDRSMLEPMGALLEQLVAELRDPAKPFVHDLESEWCASCVT